jgi:hypothetical protein
MRNFQKASFALSFLVQKAFYIITLGMGHSFTEWQGLVPSYLVIFHYNKNCILGRIIVDCAWNCRWLKKDRIIGTVVVLLVSFPSCIFVAVPDFNHILLCVACIQIPVILHFKDNLEMNTCSFPYLWFIYILKFILYMNRKVEETVSSISIWETLLYYSPYLLIL